MNECLLNSLGGSHKTRSKVTPGTGARDVAKTEPRWDPEHVQQTSRREPPATQGANLQACEGHSFIELTKFSLWFNNKSLPTAFSPLGEILCPSASPGGLHKNAWKQLEQVPTIHFENREIAAQRGDRMCQRAHSSQGHGGK